MVSSPSTLVIARGIVQHDYHDHANDPQPAQGNDSGDKSLRFPERLCEMLQSITDADSHILSWQPHGRCFIVHKTNDFVKHIMSKFFRQSKFTSFQRQLNIYGFKRMTAGPDRGAYYHEFFLQGRPDLAVHIHRIRIKGTGVKPASSPDTEPNFYAMTPCVEVANYPAQTSLVTTSSLTAVVSSGSLSTSTRKPQMRPSSSANATFAFPDSTFSQVQQEDNMFSAFMKAKPFQESRTNSMAPSVDSCRRFSLTSSFINDVSESSFFDDDILLEFGSDKLFSNWDIPQASV